MERRGESEVVSEAKQYSTQMLSHRLRQKPCFGAAGGNEETEIQSRWVTTVSVVALPSGAAQCDQNVILIIPSHILQQTALNHMRDENGITGLASQDGRRSIIMIKQMH